MRIWFDLSNSPHVNFFAAMINELQREHEVVITCRPLANTIDLLKLHNIQYNVVGRHYGANKFLKVLGFAQRVVQLYMFLRKKKLDVAISHSTFNSPLVARLLRIRSIYLNDNEHAMGNIPAFLFATTVMIPEYLSRDRVIKQGARDCRLISYPGVKEGAYLWNLSEFTGDSKRVDGRENDTIEVEDKDTIYVRPEPWAAQYYTGARNFLDPLLIALQGSHRIIVLPRGEVQAKHYKAPKFGSIRIPNRALGLAEIARNCKLFIGAGGTMTRELAVLGIPTISVYQDKLLDVDKHLIRIGYLIHKPDLDAKFVLNLLGEREHRPPARELLDKGKEAYELIKEVLLHGRQIRKEAQRHD